jgi:hypothetical protein
MFGSLSVRPSLISVTVTMEQAKGAYLRGVTSASHEVQWQDEMMTKLDKPGRPRNTAKTPDITTPTINTMTTHHPCSRHAISSPGSYHD